MGPYQLSLGQETVASMVKNRAEEGKGTVYDIYIFYRRKHRSLTETVQSIQDSTELVLPSSERENESESV